jgi:hypothetical protein
VREEKRWVRITCFRYRSVWALNAADSRAYSP